eukprot:1176619-Prorocentrum_minimum.AAC.1
MTRTRSICAMQQVDGDDDKAKHGDGYSDLDEEEQERMDNYTVMNWVPAAQRKQTKWIVWTKCAFSVRSSVDCFQGGRRGQSHQNTPP